MNSPNYSNGKVEFWKIATGAVTSSFFGSFVALSPTDPNMAIIRGTEGIQAVKLVKGKLRNFPTVEMWDKSGNANPYISGITVFRPDGNTITTQDANDDNRLYEFGLSDLERPPRFTEKFTVKALSVVYCPLEPESLLVGRVNGQLDVVSYTGYASAAQIHCHLNSHSSVKISACAWSQDRKWIATGNDHGHIHLWNGSVTTSISLARRLPTDRISPITSLIFVPDSTALIIFCGGYLTLWDIAKGVYVDNSGLPATATNIALDGPRNRVAVVVDETIFLYELKLPRQKPPQEVTAGGQQEPHHNRHHGTTVHQKSQAGS